MITTIPDPSQWHEDARGKLKGDGRIAISMELWCDEGVLACNILEDHYQKLLTGEYTYVAHPESHRILEIRDREGNRVMPLKRCNTFVY